MPYITRKHKEGPSLIVINPLTKRQIDDVVAVDTDRGFFECLVRTPEGQPLRKNGGLQFERFYHMDFVIVNKKTGKIFAEIFKSPTVHYLGQVTSPREVDLSDDLKSLLGYVD